METETYKVVKELLEKYDPAYHRKVSACFQNVFFFLVSNLSKYES